MNQDWVYCRGGIITVSLNLYLKLFFIYGSGYVGEYLLNNFLCITVI